MVRARAFAATKSRHYRLRGFGNLAFSKALHLDELSLRAVAPDRFFCGRPMVDGRRVRNIFPHASTLKSRCSSMPSARLNMTVDVASSS